MAQSEETGCVGWDNSACRGTECCPPRCPRFIDKAGVGWTFRPAQKGDEDRLVAFYDSFDTDDRTLGIPPAADHRRRSWIERSLSQGHNIVAEGDEQLVGHVHYTPADAARPELAVFVHPAYHNRGIGTELCKQAAAAAVDAGCDALELHVSRSNRAAMTVYRRLGFEVVDTEGSVQMELPLTEQTSTAVCAPPAHQS
jgi:RimJ/RimL family protein N-acetyltransferase